MEESGVVELERNDEVSVEVGVAIAVVFGDEDTVFGGVADNVIDTRDDLPSEGVDEAGEGVVHPDAAIAVLEGGDVLESGRDDDGAVVAAEAVAVAVADGFKAIDIEDVAAASGVALIAYFLRKGCVESKKDEACADEKRSMSVFHFFVFGCQVLAGVRFVRC